MTVLDLRFNAELSENNSKIFNKLARTKIKDFNKIMGELYSNIRSENFIIWAISNTGTRNPYTSKIFFYYLSYFFLKKIIRRIKFNTILVDSIVQQKIFKSLVKNTNNTILLKEEKKRNNKIKFLKFFIRFFLIKISVIFYKKTKVPKQVSLIMTYIINGYVLKSRYFPVLFEKIKRKNNIFFVPNLIIFKFSDFIKNLILIRKKKIYLLKEDFISFLDLFSIFKLNLNIKNIFKKKSISNKFLLSDLVIEEIINQKNNFSYLESYMNFIFLKNLKTKNINIKTSIVWFENQSFERTWSYTINKYHQNANNIGYMGIVPAKMYLSQDHTLPEDRKFKIIPKIILTIGNYFKNNIKKYDKQLVTKSVSALSFQHLYNTKIGNKKKQILVALPILEKEAENILKICKKLMNEKVFSNYKLIIRPHPTSHIIDIKNKINLLNIKNSRLDLNENFIHSLRKSKIFIGGMSSTCLEAIIFNIPVVVYKSNHYINSSCIPNIVNHKLYLHSNDFKKIIQFSLKNKNKSIITLDKIRQNCFKAVSNNLIGEFYL
tara:strand:- start:4633 stop:6273 length:1641 start_codon:yes stop_codon:yes gene_type:complete